MIDDGVLVERLRELGWLLVRALEELEAGREGAALVVLLSLGDALLAAQELAGTQRQLVGKLTKTALDLLELGEGHPAG